jgi:hypothetical protein
MIPHVACLLIALIDLFFSVSMKDICLLLSLNCLLFFRVHGGYLYCEAEGGRSTSARELLCGASGAEEKLMLQASHNVSGFRV